MAGNYKIYSFRGKEPKIHKNVIVGDNVVIIGDVELEENVSIWPGVVIRGDLAPIRIGKNTNIQENSVIHVDYGVPCIVGENCIIGHRALLHSASIGNCCLVGMGSIVLDGARMEDYSMLGAASLLTGGKVVESKQLWVGSPAKYFRTIGDDEIVKGKNAVKDYVRLAGAIFGMD